MTEPAQLLQILAARWRVATDPPDGWAVVAAEMPPDQIPNPPAPVVVATVADQAMAQHIADTHNQQQAALNLLNQLGAMAAQIEQLEVARGQMRAQMELVCTQLLAVQIPEPRRGEVLRSVQQLRAIGGGSPPAAPPQGSPPGVVGDMPNTGAVNPRRT